MRPLLLVFLLIACSREPAGNCRLQLVADLAVTPNRNRLVEVSGRVNRTDTQLVIDTGAQRTVLTTGTVKSLLLAHSQRSVTRLEGVGGTVSNADVFANLELGGADFKQRLAEADIPGIEGLVGGDMLSDYDVEFDLPDHRFRLWHASGCGAGDLPWSGPRSTIPVQVAGGEWLHVPVTIDGKAIDAVLDSGTAISLLQTDAARRAGVTQKALAADPYVLVRGVDGGAISVRVHRFSFLSVGDDRITAPQIGVGEMRLGAPEMLLGLDYLRSRRVWVSYRTEQIFVQRPNSESEP
jgi:predicted aspartyl protease